MREIRSPRRPGPVPGSEVLPALPGTPAGPVPLPSGDVVRIEPVPPGQTRAKEDLYAETVAGLRALGHPAAADALEQEGFLLYGDPAAPKPLGIMTSAQVRKL